MAEQRSTPATARAVSNDEGMSLVEVIIYAAMAAVIATIVTFMFINTIKGQDTVTSMTSATSRGQLAVQSIERGVRSATDFTVDSGTTLVVRTSSGTCQVWRVNTGTLQSAHTVGSTTWNDYFPLDGVADAGGAGVTVPTGATANFVKNGSSLHYAFTFVTDGGGDVTVTGDVSSRLPQQPMGSVCS